MICFGNDLQQAAIVFAVRRLIKPIWLNDRDQFLQPSGTLTFGQLLADLSRMTAVHTPVLTLRAPQCKLSTISIAVSVTTLDA